MLKIDMGRGEGRKQQAAARRGTTNQLLYGRRPAQNGQSTASVATPATPPLPTPAPTAVAPTPPRPIPGPTVVSQPRSLPPRPAPADEHPEAWWQRLWHKIKPAKAQPEAGQLLYGRRLARPQREAEAIKKPRLYSPWQRLRQAPSDWIDSIMIGEGREAAVAPGDKVRALPLSARLIGPLASRLFAKKINKILSISDPNTQIKLFRGQVSAKGVFLGLRVSGNMWGAMGAVSGGLWAAGLASAPTPFGLVTGPLGLSYVAFRGLQRRAMRYQMAALQDRLSHNDDWSFDDKAHPRWAKKA